MSNKWLDEGNGPGSPMRPPVGRYAARDALVRHHNLRGELVFQASRRWQFARAQSAAAKTRLNRALAEADAAEQQELQALLSMGIGGRRMQSLNARREQRYQERYARIQATGALDSIKGGYHDLLAKRAAVTKDQSPTSPGKASTERIAASDPGKNYRGSDSRSTWLAKVQSKVERETPITAPTIAVKAPRRGAKSSKVQTSSPAIVSKRGGKTAASGLVSV